MNLKSVLLPTSEAFARMLVAQARELDVDQLRSAFTYEYPYEQILSDSVPSPTIRRPGVPGQKRITVIEKNPAESFPGTSKFLE